MLKGMYNITSLDVGETKFFPCEGKTCANIRKAAHNHNSRTDMYFSTRHRDGVLYVTRIR